MRKKQASKQMPTNAHLKPRREKEEGLISSRPEPGEDTTEDTTRTQQGHNKDTTEDATMRSGNPHPAPKFKKGKANVNPTGRNQWTALPPEIFKLKELSREECIRVISALFKVNKDALQTLLLNPKASALELMVASCIFHAVRTGDIAVLERLLDRLIGRVALPVEHSGGIIQTNIKLNEQEKKDIRAWGAYLARSKDIPE